jgi:hypothetical protein
VEGSCENGDEPSGSIKRCEILELLSDWWLLKKDSLSASWSQLVYLTSLSVSQTIRRRTVI